MISSDSRILITGGGGFLGHHVIEALRDAGFDNLAAPSRNSCDLLNEDKVHRLLYVHRPHVIIHLAAQCGGIGANRERPAEFLYNNMMMSANLIHAASQWEVEKFVGLGSVCSYPKHTPVPFQESDLYNGYPEETNAPYGLAKRFQLEMLKAYRAQYGMRGIFLIPVNMLGEHDNFNDSSSHVIPAMLKKFHAAKLNGDDFVTLWGDGSASREFLYAGDCAQAILKAMLSYSGEEPVNIGTGKEITIRDLANKVRDIVGYTGDIKWDESKPNGQPRRCLDTSRALKEFAFEAETDLSEALARTYKWAQENDVL